MESKHQIQSKDETYSNSFQLLDPNFPHQELWQDYIASFKIPKKVKISPNYTCIIHSGICIPPLIYCIKCQQIYCQACIIYKNFTKKCLKCEQKNTLLKLELNDKIHTDYCKLKLSCELCSDKEKVKIEKLYYHFLTKCDKKNPNAKQSRKCRNMNCAYYNTFKEVTRHEKESRCDQNLDRYLCLECNDILQKEDLQLHRILLCADQIQQSALLVEEPGDSCQKCTLKHDSSLSCSRSLQEQKVEINRKITELIKIVSQQQQ